MEEEFTPVNYQYQSNIKENNKKKDSLFFNNLENEAANMDPTLNFGFNQFKNSVTTEKAIERDYELLELDEEDEDILEEETSKEKTQEVEKVFIEEDYKTMDDVIMGIKKIVTKAKSNEVPIELEEFSFDKFYQFIVRVYNDKDKN